MKKHGLLITALVFWAVNSSAQNFQPFNFGENSIPSFNAAAIIDEGDMVYFRGRYDWYQSETYSEKPYNLEVGGYAVQDWGGLSASLSYDEYSFFKRHDLSLNYAYQWRSGIFNQHHFSISGGLSFGIDKIFNYSGTDVGNSIGCCPDINFGFEYSNGKVKAGLGGRNIIGTKYMRGGAAITRNPRVLIAYFRYRWDIRDVVGIAPMVFVGHMEKPLIELNLRFDYKKIAFLSYGFRAMDLRHIISLNVEIPKTPIVFDMGYSFAQFYHAHSLSAGISVRL